MGQFPRSSLYPVADWEGWSWRTRPKWVETMSQAAGNLRERIEKGRDPAVVLRWSESNLARQLRLFGSDGSPTARAREQVAQRLEAMDRFEEARPLRELVADGYRKHFGDEHPYTLTQEEWLAINLMHSGMFTEARTLLKHIHEIGLRTLGAADDETLKASGRLAYIDEQLGDESPP
jgi:hypothetical protein